MLIGQIQCRVWLLAFKVRPHRRKKGHWFPRLCPSLYTYFLIVALSYYYSYCYSLLPSFLSLSLSRSLSLSLSLSGLGDTGRMLTSALSDSFLPAVGLEDGPGMAELSPHTSMTMDDRRYIVLDNISVLPRLFGGSNKQVLSEFISQP